MKIGGREKGRPGILEICWTLSKNKNQREKNQVNKILNDFNNAIL